MSSRLVGWLVDIELIVRICTFVYDLNDYHYKITDSSEPASSYIYSEIVFFKNIVENIHVHM